MRRRLFAGASVVSLLLLLLAATIWMRSYYWDDAIVWHADGGDTFLETAKGTFCVRHVGYSRRTSDQRGLKHIAMSMPPGFDAGVELSQASGTLPHLGFYFASMESMGQRFLTLMLPAWLIALSFGLLPSLRLLRWRSARLSKSGCSACGYLLRGNTSGVCPECGTPVAVRIGGKA